MNKQFEDENGCDTGTDISIVETSRAACDVIDALLSALEEKDRRIAILEQGQQPAGYIDAKCFEGKYPTGGTWSLKPHTTGNLNQVTPFYLAPQKQTLLGYVDMFAIMRMHEGRMSFCALRPEPKGISYVAVYAGDSVAVPKHKLNDGKSS